MYFIVRSKTFPYCRYFVYRKGEFARHKCFHVMSTISFQFSKSICLTTAKFFETPSSTRCLLYATTSMYESLYLWIQTTINHLNNIRRNYSYNSNHDYSKLYVIFRLQNSWINKVLSIFFYTILLITSKLIIQIHNT